MYKCVAKFHMNTSWLHLTFNILALMIFFVKF